MRARPLAARSFSGWTCSVAWVRGHGWVAVLLFLHLTSCTWVRPKTAYEVQFAKVPGRDLRQRMEAASDTLLLTSDPPASTALLRRRAESDVPGLLRLLRAEGYYEGRVGVRIETAKAKPVVIFEVEPGPLFALSEPEIRVHSSRHPAGDRRLSPKEVGLRPGQPAQARAMLDAVKSVERLMQTQGYPFPLLTEQQAVVDHATKTVQLNVTVDPGAPATFGPVSVSGLRRLREPYVRNLIPWAPGDPYDVAQLERYRRRLALSGLFSMANVSGATNLNTEGRLPIAVNLRERKPRSVELGAVYRTDTGAGGLAAWEHRNLFGGGERLEVSLELAETVYSAETVFHKPQFLRRDQALTLDARMARETPDAYDSRNVGGSMMITRTLDDRWTVGAGGALRFSDVTQQEEQNTYYLGSLPAEVQWNTTDDPLDPRKGARAYVHAEPFYELIGSHVAFFKLQVSAAHYWGPPPWSFLTLASRATAGNIFGASSTALPPDERFYAGGGGSIRGYAYQAVGPLDGEEPLGGRSLAEVSAELRIRFLDPLGVVVFLDGGSAFEASLPDVSERLFWGTGVGLRYFSPVGPLRFDAAVPLNRRQGIDEAFQLYVGIGQAF